MASANSRVVATVTVTLGKEEQIQIPCEVCGSDHPLGDDAYLKLFIPKAYAVDYISTSLDGIPGFGIAEDGSREFEAEEDLKFSTTSRQQTLQKEPSNTVSGKWMGKSLGTVTVKDGVATVKSTTDPKAVCNDPSDNKAKQEIGIWRTKYKSMAKIYKISTPTLETMKKSFGPAPYPLEVQFVCKLVDPNG